MPGFEFFGEEERKEVNEVLSTGILMRYGFDSQRKGIWKSKELEEALCKRLKAGYAQLTTSGTSALTTALAALGVGAGDEVIMPSFTFVASVAGKIPTGNIKINFGHFARSRIAGENGLQPPFSLNGRPS